MRSRSLLAWRLAGPNWAQMPSTVIASHWHSGYMLAGIVAVACRDTSLRHVRWYVVRWRASRVTSLGGHPERSDGQQLSVASLRSLPNTAAAYLAALQQQAAGWQSGWVWLWHGRLQITSQCTRTPRYSRPLRGRASWAPVIFNVRPHHKAISWPRITKPTLGRGRKFTQVSSSRIFTGTLQEVVQLFLGLSPERRCLSTITPPESTDTSLRVLACSARTHFLSATPFGWRSTRSMKYMLSRGSYFSQLLCRGPMKEDHERR